MAIYILDTAVGAIPKSDTNGDNLPWRNRADSDVEILLYDASETIQLSDKEVVDSLP
ncbi:MAG: hypothetical protein QNJ72_02505 [Pleurocapsa sp. MO_226.B13]|nr:hypothetical protein [Pleurocapsa sp. MO_226.B13]